MSTAAEKAAARRKAILSRGGDRLSKLTTTARGEDNPVYVGVDIPARKAPTTDTFIGDETLMPTPPARLSSSPSPQPGSSSNNASQAGWSQEQQTEFMRALMAAPDITGRHTQDASAPFPGAEAGDDPMAAMLNALTQMSGQAPPGGAGGMGMFPPGAENIQMQEPKPKSLFIRLRPILHLLLTWILLAYFAFVQEPQAYAALPGSAVETGSGSFGAIGARNVWNRWAELGRRLPSRIGEMSFGVQALPFFWAFTTLQLVLHSVQIFTKSNPIQPPTLLALALPHLPRQLRLVITNGLAYARMGGMLLDDIACLIFGVGLLVWVAGWVSG